MKTKHIYAKRKVMCNVAKLMEENRLLREFVTILRDEAKNGSLKDMELIYVLREIGKPLCVQNAKKEELWTGDVSEYGMEKTLKKEGYHHLLNMNRHFPDGSSYVFGSKWSLTSKN